MMSMYKAVANEKCQRLFESIVILFVYVIILEKDVMNFGSVQWLRRSTSYSFPQPIAMHDSWNKI